LLCLRMPANPSLVKPGAFCVRDRESASILASSARPSRVTFLLLSVMLMSIGDLYMTLTYLMSVGMMELNPIARGILHFDSPTLLGLWKVVTLSVGLSILYRLRATRKGELGAWICFMVLSALTAYWMVYVDALSELTPAVASLSPGHDPAWIVLGP